MSDIEKPLSDQELRPFDGRCVGKLTRRENGFSEQAAADAWFGGDLSALRRAMRSGRLPPYQPGPGKRGVLIWESDLREFFGK